MSNQSNDNYITVIVCFLSTTTDLKHIDYKVILIYTKQPKVNQLFTFTKTKGKFAIYYTVFSEYIIKGENIGWKSSISYVCSTMKLNN